MIPDTSIPTLVAAGYAELVRRAYAALERRVDELQRAGDRVRHARARLMYLCELAELACKDAARGDRRFDEQWAALEAECSTRSQHST